MKNQKFLKESAVVQVISTASKIEKSVNEVFSSHHLTLLQGLILVSLFFEEDKQTRPMELSATFQTTKGNISHCISWLEELKLLKRVAEVSDRRGCYVRLSKKGEDLSSKLIGYFDKLESKVEASISPIKSESLAHSLRKIRRAVKGQKSMLPAEEEFEYFT